MNVRFLDCGDRILCKLCSADGAFLMLCAFNSDSGRSVDDPIALDVSDCGNHFGCNQNFVASRALFALTLTVSCAGSGSLIQNRFGVREPCDAFLSQQGSATSGAFLALSKTLGRAGRCSALNYFLGVGESCDLGGLYHRAANGAFDVLRACGCAGGLGVGYPLARDMLLAFCVGFLD